MLNARAIILVIFLIQTQNPKFSRDNLINNYIMVINKQNSHGNGVVGQVTLSGMSFWNCPWPKSMIDDASTLSGSHTLPSTTDTRQVKEENGTCSA